MHACHGEEVEPKNGRLFRALQARPKKASTASRATLAGGESKPGTHEARWLPIRLRHHSPTFVSEPRFDRSTVSGMFLVFLAFFSWCSGVVSCLWFRPRRKKRTPPNTNSFW